MFVPPDGVSNDELAQVVDTDDEWIRTRTGVGKRHIADPGVGTSHLAVEAGREALVAAGVATDDIDALIVATMTPDFYAPGSAPLVQHALGLGRIPAYGLRQQCSGFVYGLDLAHSLIETGKAGNVLLIGAEVHTGIQPWIEMLRLHRAGEPVPPALAERADRHRHWGVLFGDGAGAVVVSAGDDPEAGILGTELRTDGSLFDLILVPALGSRSQPYADAAAVADDAHMPQMDGGKLFRNAVRLMPEVVETLLERHGYAAADVDLVIAHQANSRIVEGVRKRLGLSPEQVPMNMERYGNTTAGTLPILFHEQVQAGRVTPGALVCFVAFGAGAHWGAALYRVPTS